LIYKDKARVEDVDTETVVAGTKRLSKDNCTVTVFCGSTVPDNDYHAKSVKEEARI
jgi:hypothetical protein